MKKVCIIGGQLQGLEATYLAKQAGYETVVIDKKPCVPAECLADYFLNLDLLQEGEKVKKLLKSFDLVLPATENFQSLSWLRETSARWNYPLALDLNAYRISSSKIDSNHLFNKCSISIPKPWPECGFPLIVKPSSLSGSKGVKRVESQIQLDAVLQEMVDTFVIQEFLAGPSFSLEVIGDKGACVGLQITELEFDAGYDCKRVIAGPRTGISVENELYALGEGISRALSLSGIMDIEVIAVGNKLKVLEIDARFPSQTPTAVFHSTGINMVELLLDYWNIGKLPNYRRLIDHKKAVIYEHLELNNSILRVQGEHCLVGARNLKLYENLFGAKTIISNFEESPLKWVATVIFEGRDEDEAWANRNQGIKAICTEFKVNRYLDLNPFD